MDYKIGVLMDDKKKITDLFHMTYISIFELKKDWEVVKTLDSIQVDTSSAAMLRTSIEVIVKQLDACKILIGTSIIGMPYHVFERNGFVLCEADELDKKLLDQVYEDYCREKDVQDEELLEPIPTSPQPVDNDGNFFFDFIKSQKYHPEVSSKKALLPFLSHELFQTLTIVCSHIMPWLGEFIKSRGQKMNSKREDGRYTIIISHEFCRDNDSK